MKPEVLLQCSQKSTILDHILNVLYRSISNIYSFILRLFNDTCTNSLCRVLLESLFISQPYFKEPNGSLLCSEKLTFGLYSEPVHYSGHLRALFIEDAF